MKVGDLVTATWVRTMSGEAHKTLGIILCIDPEEIGDNEEVDRRNYRGIVVKLWRSEQ